jgi:hypothetical protein
MNRATGALELTEKTPVPDTDKPSPDQTLSYSAEMSLLV